MDTILTYLIIMFIGFVILITNLITGYKMEISILALMFIAVSWIGILDFVFRKK